MRFVRNHRFDGMGANRIHLYFGQNVTIYDPAHHRERVPISLGLNQQNPPVAKQPLCVGDHVQKNMSKGMSKSCETCKYWKVGDLSPKGIGNALIAHADDRTCLLQKKYEVVRRALEQFVGVSTKTELEAMAENIKEIPCEPADMIAMNDGIKALLQTLD